jgi:hypothetical protein
MKGTLTALAAASVVTAVGCGAGKPHGYFDMTALAAGIKAEIRSGPSQQRRPSSVACAKTGPVEADCVVGFREPGSAREATFTDTVKIAADGNSYEVTKPHG